MFLGQSFKLIKPNIVNISLVLITHPSKNNSTIQNENGDFNESRSIATIFEREAW